jgi:hypothetical protein
MKNLCLCLTLCTSLIKAQVQENFSDGNLSLNPVWIGDTSKWAIINGQLRSNSTTAKDTIYLSTASTLAAQAQWEFYVNLKFATSGSNYTDVYLICNNANLKSDNKTGYFVRIGNTKDEIALYKRVGGKNTKIIDGADGITNTTNNTFKIKVTRNINNVWKLKRDATGTGLSYIIEGTTTDSTFNSSSYFGIFVKQSTSSFYQKHFFDDISVMPLISDKNAPSIISTTVVSPTQLDVLYNEYVDITSSEKLVNYLLNDSLGSPSSALRDATNPALVHLTFATAFTDSLLNTLNISGVEDFNDNVIISADVQFTYYAPALPVFKDVIINELFADPSPSHGLPDAEFVEIYNRSSKTFNLKDWQLGDATGFSVITTSNSFIAPQEYLIICRDLDSSLYKPFGRVIGMTGFPSLNNTGDKMYLKGSNLVVTDSVSYSDTWYQSASKKEGGYTLELIKPMGNINCPAFTNWSASSAANGGTPGTVNSVYSTANAPAKLLSVNCSSNDSIHLVFSSAIDTVAMSNVLRYSIDREVGNPKSVSIGSEDIKTVLLKFAEPLQQGIAYTIIVNGISDCSGNIINTGDTKTFVIPQSAEANDLVINEILADPKAGGVDFIELYNRSNKIIDLKTVFVSQYDTTNNIPLKQELIITESRLIYPKEYIVLSKNGEAIKKQYSTTNPTGFINVTKMPTMNIASGAVCLSTHTRVIDYFTYDEKMQFALLNDTKGVSLERIDFNRPAQDKTNWHSAAQTVGFATPAYENSQYYNVTTPDDNIKLSPELFSPDEDGINDVLSIGYKFEVPGYMGNISIYDSRGRLIKTLVRNELLGTSGTYSWDGVDENNEKARIGIYVIYFETFDLTGKVKQYKKPCVVAGK